MLDPTRLVFLDETGAPTNMTDGRRAVSVCWLLCRTVIGR
jgi:hypothetical protein